MKFLKVKGFNAFIKYKYNKKKIKPLQNLKLQKIS
jgi:hypothetical protein